MSYLKGEKKLMRFEYDFDKDGGAVSAISLSQAAKNDLDGLKIVNAYVVVEEDLASGGTPTITFGNTTDADGYMVDCFSELDSKGGIMAGEVAGALIFDDTNDHLLMYSPSVADDKDVVMTIGTAALTAGKLAFYLEVLA